MSKLSALTGAVLLAAGLLPAVVSASVPVAPGSTATQPGSRKI